MATALRGGRRGLERPWATTQLAITIRHALVKPHKTGIARLGQSLALPEAALAAQRERSFQEKDQGHLRISPTA